MKKRVKIISALALVFLLLASCYKETPIKVNATFDAFFVNDDRSAPVKVSIRNKTENADTYQWTFEGGIPASSTDENPGDITFEAPGKYTIKLLASNVDAESDTFEKSVMVVENIDIQFTAEVVQSNYPPVEVVLKNTTVGNQLTYRWTFEGGTPATSTSKVPPKVTFNTPGDHLISLEVSNGVESFKETTTINVLPKIEVDFDWEVDFFDDDYQAPVTIQLNTSATSVTNYEWTIEGGTPSISSNENPKVTFKNAGTYTIKLKVSNDKQSKFVNKTINIAPNTNLRVFTNVALGINTAHQSNTTGAFFSSELRKVLTNDQVNDENGGKIDLVFLGLNDTFTYNKFVSPAQADANGFKKIPNAKETKIINSQEVCDCGVSFTVADFDTMANDIPLQNLIINETANGSLHFTNEVVPRVVLFQTEEGRKGAIKIKEFVSAANSSYIICDIKIQKLP